MRRLFVLGLLLSSSVTAGQATPPGQASPAQQPRTTIRGRAVSAEHGAALPRVRIEIISTGPSSFVFTEDDGRFSVTRAQDSSITLLATKAGYAALAVRAPSITAGSSSELLLRLERSGALSGRVTDPIGAPAVGIRVSAQRVDETSASSTSLQFSSTTDDLGAYRIGGLPAGRYQVGLDGPILAMQGGVLRSLSVAGDLGPGVREAFDKMAAQVRLSGDRPPATQNSAQQVDIGRGAEVTDIGFVTELKAIPGPVSRETAERLRAERVNGAIRGRVLTRSGEPIADAAIRLLKDGTIASATVTDRQGQFAFDVLPPDRYKLEAEKAGYLMLRYGQSDPAQMDETIALEQDKTLEGVDIVLPRASAISGTVVDEYGEPLQGVSVQALQLQHAEGGIVARRWAFDRRTDDRGQYRVFGLTPGTYVVMATADTAVPAFGVGSADASAPIYAPGTAHIQSATRVEVGLTQDLAGVDVAFARSRGVRVSGVAIDSAGRPLVGIVSLSARRQPGAIAAEPRLVRLGAEGAFSLTDVVAGEYVVQAVGTRGPGRAAELGIGHVSVGDNDPPLVTIRTSAGTTLSGRIVVDGQQSRVSTVSLLAVSVDGDRVPVGSDQSTFSISSSGAFYFTGLHGPTRFALSSRSDGWYLKSVTIGGVDVTYSGFDFGFAQHELTDAEIEIAFATGAIAGRVVVDERATARADAAVVAFSTDREKWFATSGHLKTVRASEDGSFLVGGLPVGEYWIAAVDRLEGVLGSGDWQTREVLDDLSLRASRVTIGDGERLTMSLRLIRR